MPSDLPALPGRTPRASEAASWLREQILAGTWGNRLPGEMPLARQMQVGRNTLRCALAQLEAEGMIQTHLGRHREILGGQPCRVLQQMKQTAILLLGVPFAALAPSALLWMEALRTRLEGAGWRLQIRVEAAAFRKAPAKILEDITAGQSGAVWVLYRSTADMQSWFEKRGLLTIIAGTRHEGILLPQLDTDYRAASRHAAIRFIANGHRHLGVVAPKAQLAGDAESLAGFSEGAETAQVEILTHNDTPEGVAACMHRLLGRRAMPTGLFVLRAEHCATVLTWLAKQGLGCPGRISVICRDDEPFLRHLFPEPTRYRRSAESYARTLFRLVTASVAAQKPSNPKGRFLMPDFVKGGTLGRAFNASARPAI